MTKSDNQIELRNRFKATVKSYQRAQVELKQRGINEWEMASYLPRYDWGQFVALTCGARTRAGSSCKQRGLFDNGRCKLHGGLSTGPRTQAGKAVSARNGYSPKRTP